MERRCFVRLGVSAGIGFGVPGIVDSLLNTPLASGPPDLAVVRGTSPAAIARTAVEALGGMGSFVSRGDVVVVKPNIGFDRVPEQAATTNPEVVAEVVRLCLEAGAKQVKVFDRTVNDPRRCYVQSGVAAALKPLGADLQYVNDRKFRKVRLNGRALKEWKIYSDVLEADKVINIPIAKHHSLAKLTMAMKNWMGVIGDRRSRIHQKLDLALVDLASEIRPTLTILDAVRVLVANGPQGGYLEDVRTLNTVVAGVDQVAVDSFGATLFGLTGRDLGYVREAERAGLGTADLSKLNIHKLNA
jgi:uncharacterized protein (DUF362 family)